VSVSPAASAIPHPSGYSYVFDSSSKISAERQLEAIASGKCGIKLYHADCARAVADYARQGYPVIQSGRFDQDEHYYLDTERDFGYVIELGNAGRIPGPDRRYPG
jgi:hypothetical protein